MTRDVHLEKLYNNLVSGDKFGPAMRKVGVWSDTYSRTPARLKSSKKYNKFMNSKLKTIESHLEKIMEAMGEANLSEERHHELVQSYERLFKLKLVIQEKPTEITQHIIRQMTDAEIDAEEERLLAELNGQGKTSDAPSAGEAEEGESEA